MRVNHHLHPRLTDLARKYLRILPTSTDSERLWSNATWLYSELRSRLTPDRLSMMLFLKANSEQFGKVLTAL